MRKTAFTIIFVASVCVTILASIAVVAPKAVRAAVATLIRDQDNAARHPWTASCTMTSFNNCSMPLSSGNEYVIQSISLSLAAYTTNPVILAASCTTGGSSALILSAVLPLVGTGPQNGSNAGVYQTYPLTANCDPGGGVQIDLIAFGPAPQLAGQIVANGYYVTLP